jgi:hypothetical protein
VATALASADPGAPFKTLDGDPDWQGFIVYWQSDDGGLVYRAFEPESGMDALIYSPLPDRAKLEMLARSAVTAAIGETAGGTAGGDGGGSAGGISNSASGSAVAMRYVASISASIDTVDADVSLQVVTASASGTRSNTSTFNTDVFTRN